MSEKGNVSYMIGCDPNARDSDTTHTPPWSDYIAPYGASDRSYRYPQLHIDDESISWSRNWLGDIFFKVCSILLFPLCLHFAGDISATPNYRSFPRIEDHSNR